MVDAAVVLAVALVPLLCCCWWWRYCGLLLALSLAVIAWLPPRRLFTLLRPPALVLSVDSPAGMVYEPATRFPQASFLREAVYKSSNVKALASAFPCPEAGRTEEDYASISMELMTATQEQENLYLLDDYSVHPSSPPLPPSFPVTDLPPACYALCPRTHTLFAIPSRGRLGAQRGQSRQKE